MRILEVGLYQIERSFKTYAQLVIIRGVNGNNSVSVLYVCFCREGTYRGVN